MPIVCSGKQTGGIMDQGIYFLSPQHRPVHQRDQYIREPIKLSSFLADGRIPTQYLRYGSQGSSEPLFTRQPRFLLLMFLRHGRTTMTQLIRPGFLYWSNCNEDSTGPSGSRCAGQGGRGVMMECRDGRSPRTVAIKQHVVGSAERALHDAQVITIFMQHFVQSLQSLSQLQQCGLLAILGFYRVLGHNSSRKRGRGPTPDAA
jgi:hypothetical protein